MKNLFKKGFTLIELLIVIAIIGILTALILPNLAGARERARDSRRKTDLSNIQQALRLYYNDNQSFPLTDRFTSLPSTYISVIPKDPSSTAATTINYTYASLDGNTYVLRATLENKSDPDRSDSQSRCLGPDYDTQEYVVCEQ